MIPCVIERPNPEPVSFPEIIGKKIDSLISSGIPGPLSLTEILQTVFIDRYIRVYVIRDPNDQTCKLTLFHDRHKHHYFVDSIVLYFQLGYKIQLL